MRKGLRIVQANALDLMAVKRGHYLLESGYHADRRINVNSFLLHPKPLLALAQDLGDYLAKMHIDLICGSMIKGAFVGLLVAAQLDVEFIYSERTIGTGPWAGSAPVKYRFASALPEVMEGRRVAIVCDVIDANSALPGTAAAVQERGAKVSAIGALLTVGASAFDFAASRGIPLKSSSTLAEDLFWTGSDCPLCKAGVPLEVLGVPPGPSAFEVPEELPVAVHGRKAWSLAGLAASASVLRFW